MTDGKIKEIIMSNSREWIKDILEDIAVLRVEDFIEELQAELKKLRVGDVIVCPCGSTEYYSEQYKDVTKYYCNSCHQKLPSKN